MSGRLGMRKGAFRSGLALLAAVATLSACEGQNLFVGPVSAGGTGPDVEITVPIAGVESVIGDSILVQAEVTASRGAASATYSGIYPADGTTAFTAESADLNGLSSVFLSNYLRASPGQVAGTAIVIVSVTDLSGQEGADSVTVTITEGLVPN